MMAENVAAEALALVLSNMCLCWLKTNWPERGKTCATQALRAIQRSQESDVYQENTFDQSKLYYRRALAYEQLKDFSNAVEDLKRAIKEQERVASGAAERQKIVNELKRMQKLEKEFIENQFQKDRTKYSYNSYTVK